MLTHHSTGTWIKQEVGSVGGNRRLIRDWTMTKRHANNGGHVSLCAEYVDGNPSGLSYKHINLLLVSDIFIIMLIKAIIKVFWSS